MNVNEAITILRRLQDPEPHEPAITESTHKALEMGINALKDNAVKSTDSELAELKIAIDRKNCQIEFLHGLVEGLKYSIKCNGVSGAGVKD